MQNSRMALAIMLVFLSFSLSQSQDLIEVEKRVDQSRSHLFLNIIDSDNDHQMELVSVANRHYIVIQDINADGKLSQKWISTYIGIDDPSDGKIACLTVGNVDTDINTEILYCNYDGDLTVVDATTKEIELRRSLPYRNPVRMEIASLSGMDQRHLIITQQSRIFVLDIDTFSELWSSPSLKTSYFILEDIDGDSNSEILFGQDSIQAYDLEEDSVYTIFERKSLSYCIADITGDGTIEAITTDASGLYVYNFPDFSLKSFKPGLYSSTKEICAKDVNKDGALEFYFNDGIFLSAYDMERDVELWSASDRVSHPIFTDALERTHMTVLYSNHIEGNTSESHLFHVDAFSGNLIWTNTVFSGTNFHFLVDYNGDGNEELGTLQNIHSDFYNQGSQIRIEKYNGVNNGELLFTTHPENPYGRPDIITSIITGKFLAQSSREQIIYLHNDGKASMLTLMDGGQIVREKDIGYPIYNALVRKGNLDNDEEVEFLSLIARQIQIFDLKNTEFVLKRSLDLTSHVDKLKLIDINGDARDEIILIRSTRNDLVILDALSLEIIYETNEYHFKDFAWGDITGDNQKELVFNVSYPVEFVVLDSIGGDFKELNAPRLYKGGIYEMTFADIDSNLVGEELITIFDSLFVLSLDVNNPLVIKGNFTGLDNNFNHPATDIISSDLEGDGIYEIHFGTDEGLYHYQYHSGITTALWEEDEPTVSNFRILQNPVRDRLDILTLRTNLKESEFLLLDNTGHVVSRMSVSNTKKNEVFSIPLSGLPSGLYYLNFVNDNARSCLGIIKL